MLGKPKDKKVNHRVKYRPQRFGIFCYIRKQDCFIKPNIGWDEFENWLSSIKNVSENGIYFKLSQKYTIILENIFFS